MGRRAVLALVPVALGLMARPHRGHPRGPRRGGVLKQIGVEPLTFDIQATVSCRTPVISSLVRRTLFNFVNGVRYGASDFTPVPDLAVRATASPDGRVYTIAVPQGVRWERKPPVNGRELTAADVKYSMELALARSPYTSLLGPVPVGEQLRAEELARPRRPARGGLAGQDRLAARAPRRSHPRPRFPRARDEADRTG
jgi:ABC-type transport system substrate-binding protein